MGLALAGVPALAADELCAEVKIEILQELTLERQAFEASMRITNSLDSFALEDISVSVDFRDASGSTITATSDSSASDAAFFIRLDDTQGVSGLASGADGAVAHGVIDPKGVGEIRWLIIPTAESGGQTDDGALYFVGATLNYEYGGKRETVQVAPDSIVVKPQPQLTLDYFLTREVVADDAFTPELEPAKPYTLGLRMTNTGYGTASNVQIDSAQPTIVENEQGLAVDFKILGSYLDGQPASDSLLINFGNIPAREVSVGRWIMESSLSGEFTEFSANFTHADALGGELTSLLSATNAHLLVKDVVLDLPGRDSVRDFLALDQAGELFLFESERTGADTLACQNCVAVAAPQATLGAEQVGIRNLDFAAESGPVHLKVSDPYAGSKVLVRAVRSDGKILDPANLWLSQSRAEDNRSFDYFINLFDINSSGSYSLYFADSSELPQPPVIRPISDRTTYEGGQLGFLLQSSDPNGTIPQLSLARLPAGATFEDKGNGTGVFNWHPAVGQTGDYQLAFTATDGALSSQLDVTVRVNPAADKDGDGLDDDWEQEHFGNLDRDGSGDFDDDGRSDQTEFEEQTDPTVAEVVPGVPQLDSPIYDGEILAGAEQPLLPQLSIRNGAHSEADQVVYLFEVYADQALTTLIASARIEEGADTTIWAITEAELAEGQGFADNSHYYWRARAELANDNSLASQWLNSRFFINTANDAPTAPQVSQPADSTLVASLQPTLAVTNASDVDLDNLSYGFDLFSESDSETALYSITGLTAGEQGETRWQVPQPLSEDSRYRWQTWAEDSHGLRSYSELAGFQVSLENHPPTQPAIEYPADGLRVSALDAEDGLSLRIANATDPEWQPLGYAFEIDKVNTFDSADWLSSGVISEGAGSTEWAITGLVENTHYYWRAKASDGEAESVWVQGQFFVNTYNDAPPLPTAMNPGMDAVVESLQPRFELTPVTDPDSTVVHYHFELYSDSSLTNWVASAQGSESGWAPEFELLDNQSYYWRFRTSDEEGGDSGWSASHHFFTNENGYNDAPEFNFVLPDQQIILEQPELLIQWSDSDPDSNARISLFYSDVEGGGSAAKTLIVADLAEDPDAEQDQFLWNAGQLPPGRYQISAEISDGDHLVAADACCDLVVPPQNKTLSITPLTELASDESGTRYISVEVVLDYPLEAGSSLTLNYSLSDEAEATIEGDSFLYFTADNWDQPQTIRIKGRDDCEIDGDASYSLIFQAVASDDEAYAGYLPGGLALVNSDNEQPGQELFICDYQLLSQTAVEGSELSEYQFRARLNNEGVSLKSASAQLMLLPGVEEEPLELISAGSLQFDAIASGTSKLSNETFTLRHKSGEPLPAGRLSWSITPGDAEEVLQGNDDNNRLYGTEADDVIEGLGGNDLLKGGAGNDTLIGGSGADTIYGEAGDDLIVITGSDPYADRVDGGEGYDVIQGGYGDDEIRLSYIKSVEEIDGQGGRNVILGTSANNRLDFSNTRLVNIDYIDGLAGNDTIYGSQGDDTLIGNSGSDYLFGNGGNDTFVIEGNDAGIDRIAGGEGIDQLIGGEGDDRFRLSYFANDYRVEQIDGRGGINIIEGSESSNHIDLSETQLSNIARIEGLGGNDQLKGSQGDDVLLGGDGNDALYGNGGDDRFIFSSSDSGYDRYNGGDGIDTLQGSVLDDDFRISYFGKDWRVEIIDGDGGVNRILGSDSNNSLDFRGVELISIAQIEGGKGNDYIYGSDGADVIIGGEGNDYHSGGGGDDRFLLTPGDSGYDRYSGGDGVDRLEGTDADDLGPGIKEVVVEAFEAPGFDRASAGEIPWVEINREPAAAQVTAAPLLAIGFGLAGSRQIKVGYGRTRLQNNTPESRSPRGCKR